MLAVAAAVIFTATSDDFETPGCAVTQVALWGAQRAVIHRDEYPVVELQRPVALPRGLWSVRATGTVGSVTSVLLQTSGTASVAFSPDCRLEVGVSTSHGFTPRTSALLNVAPRLRVSVVPGSLAVEAQVVIPTTFDGATMVWAGVVGAPLKLLLGRDLALQAFDHLVTVFFGQTTGPNVFVSASIFVPVGLLFQVAERVSFEVAVRPTWSLSRFGWAYETAATALARVVLVPQLDLAFSGTVASGVQQRYFAAASLTLRL